MNEKTYIKINGCNVAYKITGTGDQVVVMLQGWGTSFGVYDSIAKILGDKYKFVQFDFPGFGDSEEPDEAWNVDGYVAFFREFMKALGINKATLMGHSYGGRVIIKLASSDIEDFEIERIVLVDSAGIVPKKTFSQKVKIMSYKVLKKIYGNKVIYALFPELVDDWRNRQGSEDYRNASPVMRKALVMAVNEDLKELLPFIKQETLLIWGDEDTATPISDGKTMEDMIENAGLVVLEGAGHFSFLDKPDVFENVIRAFFEVG